MSHTPTPCKYALCAPGVLDALDDALDSARTEVLQIAAAYAEDVTTLRGLLDRAAVLMATLQTDLVNLPPGNARTGLA